LENLFIVTGGGDGKLCLIDLESYETIDKFEIQEKNKAI